MGFRGYPGIIGSYERLASLPFSVSRYSVPPPRIPTPLAFPPATRLS